MFIRNIKDLNVEKHYICNKTIGNYLVKNGIPLLSRIDDKMVFVKTNKLQEVLNSMPFYIKLFGKGGVEFGK